MTVAIEDVKVWRTYGGISHVVTETDGHWTFTLCGSMWSGGVDAKDPVKRRVCRKCRHRLPNTNHVGEGSTE